MYQPVEAIVRRPLRAGEAAVADDLEPLVRREWLVTNGLGGYASGTVVGVPTRRYHGLLVASLRNPLGRTVMLNHLIERVVFADGSVMQLEGEERLGRQLEVPAARSLADFRLEAGLPVWEYTRGDATIERRVMMPHRQNTVIVLLSMIKGGAPVRLELQPAVHFRGYESPVNAELPEGYRLTVDGGLYVVSAPGAQPPLRIQVIGREPSLTIHEQRLSEILYRVEESRGYEFTGALWTPGCLNVSLAPFETVAFIASTESVEVMSALTPEQAFRAELERRRRLVALADSAASDEVRAELVLASDQFVVTPAGRIADTARAWAVGEEVRTVIAGYHWFTDWGRDTMISLEGLTLTSGRYREAGAILRAFAQHVRDGLIPNLFPDGSDEGLYHTADATLWFFHAMDRYVEVTGDRALLHQLLPTLRDIVERHLAGTHYGIGVDPRDGLLHQGAGGYQLTWMDAKVGDWVVTPRRGKAVEINALWYNALCLLQRWLREMSVADGAGLAEHATRARRSFNERFWYEPGGYLYDVVDGPDGDSAECRPNQLLAISLPNPVLERARWESVVDVVRRRLLTPVGLRSLAPGSTNYSEKYYGDLRARDAAYHQGTVWAWLVGPWIDVWIKLHPDHPADAREFLQGLIEHLDDYGVGSIAEIFDAEPPYTPRGCIAQAWSVAEVLRCWAKTADASVSEAR
jgi:predicted glycogen debranching enzyme